MLEQLRLLLMLLLSKCPDVDDVAQSVGKHFSGLPPIVKKVRETGVIIVDGEVIFYHKKLIEDEDTDGSSS